LTQSDSSVLLMLMLVIVNRFGSLLANAPISLSAIGLEFRLQAVIRCECYPDRVNAELRARNRPHSLARRRISIMTRSKNNSRKRARQKRLRAALLHLPFTSHLLTLGWWNWQTRTFEGRMPKGLRVRVPPRARSSVGTARRTVRTSQRDVAINNAQSPAIRPFRAASLPIIFAPIWNRFI
jgi:hypothetical protein